MLLKKHYNINDLRVAAKSKLPAPLFHYIDGGADDEWTLKRNSDAFNRYQLVPRVLRNVEKIDLRTQIFGLDCALPFFLSPTGMSRLFHHQKELAVARAAQKYKTIYSLSTLGTTSLEDIAQTINTPKMFQIYILKDRGLTLEFVDRCKKAGYEALCLTVDMAMAGNRERDMRTGMVMPPKFGLRSLWSFATHPFWTLNYAIHPSFALANVVHRVDALGSGVMGLIDYVNSQFDRTVTWDDVAWLREQWDGPLIIKGVLSPDDGAICSDIGADGIMISNHGGRQLDGAPSPMELVGEFRAVVGENLQLVVDGGIRRGTDIVKALAMGADACSIGKAYLYGLSAGGQSGVERALEILTSEIKRTMTLLGCASVRELTQEHLREIERI